MSKEKQYSRRSVLQTVAGGVIGGPVAASLTLGQERQASGKINGNLKQSVCKWCYKDMSVEQLAYEAARIGLKSVELLGPEDWPVLKKYGLTCAMGSGAGPIENGLNRKENHERWIHNLRKHIELAPDLGIAA